MADQSRHSPVMLAEVLEALAPRDGGIYVDATFGAGGYTRALLEAADCTVWGIDRDPLAQSIGADMGRAYAGRLTVLAGRFGDMKELLAAVGVERVDGVALDLGVSSMQLDDPARGFSFRADGPLDMRMGTGDEGGMSAADVVNSMAERELADLIYKYGEERASRRVARAIVELRAKAPITRTEELADLVRRVVKKSKDGIDPATRTFQALRIFVNDELGELARGLAGAEALLAPGGRLAVVSFHSLEDRAVKEFLRERSGAGPRPSRHLPDLPGAARQPTFTLISRGAEKPDAAETRTNPRARSARLRWAVRTDAPARAAA
ncbi:MAG: 16S rRNA (cytosine(1402)-N(4))-methyltransferase [Rhodospirillales bacterium CG15_BIG_FIL_POST_REV_8_21_14_020_66_15]|nr:MAG: 16S rRNA (cytosine(1402)-N(4))-methyltransferase [Rhodospirillales bacterium CG15_BIG_FIL_POST_REV_8_21_14_020_66_15]